MLADLPLKLKNEMNVITALQRQTLNKHLSAQ